jgi:hypothetical protein
MTISAVLFGSLFTIFPQTEKNIRINIDLQMAKGYNIHIII